MTRTLCCGWVVLLLVVGCDQTVDDGSDSGIPDTVRIDGVLADQQLEGGTVTDQALVDAPAGLAVNVTYNGEDKLVQLGQLTPVTFEGFPSAVLADVVSLAFPGVAHAGLTADFMSSDGFKPGSKSNCDGLVPVPGANFAKGYIDVATRKLRWALDLAYPGCLQVADLAEIELADQ